MSTLLFALNRGGVAATDDDVRSTTNVINQDAPSAVQDAAPEYNDHDTDPDTEGGITPHQLASHVVPSEQYPPAIGNANDDPNSIVNRQVSTSGTAAAREASGQWGHGSLMITEGIEPTIRDGAAFGDTYFAARDRDVQEGMGGYMQPAVAADAETLATSQASGKVLARDAAADAMWTAFHNARMAGM